MERLLLYLALACLFVLQYNASFVLSPRTHHRNLALEQRMATVEESIERAGAQLTQIVTAAKVPSIFSSHFTYSV